MPTTLKPTKTTGIFTSSKLNYAVNPAIMKNFRSILTVNNAVNILSEAPTADKIYTYNGKNYAKPQFELLSNDNNSGVPGQKGFQFTKDTEGNLRLNIIAKAFHPQKNVTPLDFKSITVVLHYKNASGIQKVHLQIIQIVPDKATNVLKHIYAQTVIKEADKEAVYKALITPDGSSKLIFTADVWWQKPTPNSTPTRSATPTPPRRTTPTVKDACSIFDKNTIKITGNSITTTVKKRVGPMQIGTPVPLLKFRNPSDAKKAYLALKHYKLDRKCNVGSTFTYFLSGNNAPTGKLRGEDAIEFTPSKLQVKFVQKRWKIVEGNRYLFDFGSNRNNANKAFAIIKKHGFDTVCYIGRPNPGMTYLKRTKSQRMQLFHAVIQPRMLEAIRTTAQPAQPSKPQKITVTSQQILLFDKEDATVFQGFFDALESNDFKWRKETKIKHGEIEHSYYYRLTNDPNKVFFLPQVYRIGVNHKTGEPKMYLNLYENEKDNGDKEYRIQMTMFIEPYYHPLAKKDLLLDLADLSKGNIKYVENLVLGGYQNVSFKIEDRFAQENALFSIKITEELQQIDPVGFTITADHSLESFEAFKEEFLANGINIGKIFFDLEEETEAGVTVKESHPINVELNFEKLKNIPLTVESIDGGTTGILQGFYLKNQTPTPVTVENVDLTLLATNDNFIYDVDYELHTKGVTWPLSLAPGDREGIFINQDDVDQLSDKNMVWTNMVCEPYGVRAAIDPEKIMASVVDRATGDTQQWTLNVSSPLFENWDTCSEEEKTPYKKIMGVLVEIRNSQGEIIASCELNKANPRQLIKMTNTVQQLLNTKKQDNRKYEFRQTNITLTPSTPSEWESSENTSIEHLYIYPKV
ncbi:hypothetical protein [Tenacibaculum amylolyticum]|uniref:hypothetical protein n=1 Tax=Tenacibaculum amylolyticum TaxID=104269 RepID=UPI003894FEAF